MSPLRGGLIAPWDLLNNKKNRISPALCCKVQPFRFHSKPWILCNNWPPLLRLWVKVRWAERTKKKNQTETEERRHEGKTDGGGKWERRGHGELILAFKDGSHSNLNVFASLQRDRCVLKNTGRRETESTCTSHYLECTEWMNSSLEHIIYIYMYIY